MSVKNSDLLLALHGGIYEERRFSTFLETLRQRIEVDYVGMFFGQGDTPMHETTKLSAGRDLLGAIWRLGIADLHFLKRFPFVKLTPFTLYNVGDLLAEDGAFKKFRDEYIQRIGIREERIIRVTTPEGVNAWLLVSSAGEIGGAECELIKCLSPHIALAVRNFALIEQQRVHSKLSEEARVRSRIGRITFDSDAKIIDIDLILTDWLASEAGVRSRPGTRLCGLNQSANRALIDAIDLFVADQSRPPLAVLLVHNPRLDALLCPMTTRPAAALKLPVMQAICRLPTLPSHDRVHQLAEIFGLSNREAQLAIALSEGFSIAGAASMMGITIETARIYSKKIYSKTGTNGQTNLVRTIHESAVMLA